MVIRVMGKLGNTYIYPNRLRVVDGAVLSAKYSARCNCIPPTVLPTDCDLPDIDWLAMEYSLDSSDLGKDQSAILKPEARVDIGKCIETIMVSV
jgi:hypothetical protein